MGLKGYMVYDKGHKRSEGAVLVFAHRKRDARQIYVMACAEIDFIIGVKDTAADLFWGGWDDEEFHYVTQWADQGKLAAGIPHLIHSPPLCPHCESWGGKPYPHLNQCSYCLPEDDSTDEDDDDVDRPDGEAHGLLN